MAEDTRTNTRCEFMRYGAATAAVAATAKILPQSLSDAHADEAGIGSG